MRSLTLRMVFAGCLATACGSASNSGLFGSSTETGCGSATGCGALSTGGAGSSSASSGGAANLGGESSSGGSTGSAGSESSGGDPGKAGSSSTGGDVGVAGQGAGGGGKVDSGVTPSAHCPEGDYHAVLMGAYRSALGSRDVGATIDFSVTASGAAMGMFAGPGGAKATVTGMLDCASGALTAKIEDGSYQVGLTTAHFSGTFDGAYHQATSSFVGMWVMTETGSTTNGGNGPWMTQ